MMARQFVLVVLAAVVVQPTRVKFERNQVTNSCGANTFEFIGCGVLLPLTSWTYTCICPVVLMDWFLAPWDRDLDVTPGYLCNVQDCRWNIIRGVFFRLRCIPPPGVAGTTQSLTFQNINPEEKTECYAVDLKRVAILVTGDQQVDNMENWGITDNGFTMTLKSNFGSPFWRAQWTPCTYTFKGQFVNSQDQPCVVPTGTHIPGYDCYMKDFPTIYLTESQMNEGLLVDVYGEIGENNDAVIWDYEFRFTEWKADDVKNGVKESWATRTGSNGRRARHFFKYTYTDNSNCNLNVNEFFDCE